MPMISDEIPGPTAEKLRRVAPGRMGQEPHGNCTQKGAIGCSARFSLSGDLNPPSPYAHVLFLSVFPFSPKLNG
jgi:hypothetical protein